MSEYIEKGKLIDYVQDAYGGGNEDNTCIWYGDVIEMIRSEPAAHPQMREVALILLDKVHWLIPVCFDDIWSEYHADV